MDNVYLYCKSYINDLQRVKVLCESVEKYNLDKIPFYISCPKTDYQIFKSNVPSSVNLITDEDICQVKVQNWKTQQIVKSQFWKYIPVSNYVCIDSDSYFIKPFKVEDFIVKDDIPYTVMHEQKNLFHWTIRYRRDLGFDPQKGFNETREKIGALFNRKFKVNYDFGPSPIIWSSKVWKSLEDNYLQPNGLTFDQLIEYEASEFTWYGESLLAFKPIDIYPKEPLFLVFHYGLQYQQLKQQGYTIEDIKDCYMGIVMTSNWNAPLKY